MHIPNSFIASSRGADIAAFFTNLNMKTPYRALLVHFLGVSGSFSYAAPQLDQTPLKNSQRFTLRYKEYGEIRLIASCDRKRKLSNQQCLTFYLKEFIQLNETPCACPQVFTILQTKISSFSIPQSVWPELVRRKTEWKVHRLWSISIFNVKLKWQLHGWANGAWNENNVCQKMIPLSFCFFPILSLE